MLEEAVRILLETEAMIPDRIQIGWLAQILGGQGEHVAAVGITADARIGDKGLRLAVRAGLTEQIAVEQRLFQIRIGFQVNIAQLSNLKLLAALRAGDCFRFLFGHREQPLFYRYSQL